MGSAMRSTVRVFARGAAVALAVVALNQSPQAMADDYPNRAVTMIVPWPAGGAVDTLVRAVTPKLAERLGKPIIVENRPGAGSTLGTTAAAKAAPDGYTLGVPGSGSLTIGPTLYKKLPYDPLKDFEHIALIGRVPFVLVVNPALPVRTVPDLIKYSKEKPLSFASGGAGSPHHLYAELFKSMTGIQMTHIPYKGSAPAVTDVVAGHVPLMFCDPAPAVPLIREGKVRAIGVTTLTRWSVAPEIPTLNEAGLPGFEAAGWFFVSAPAGTPKAIVNRLHADLKAVLGSPDVQQVVNRTGVVPVVSPPIEELTRLVNSEAARWSKVVIQAGLAGSE